MSFVHPYFIKAVIILKASYLLRQPPTAIIGKWKGEDKPTNHIEFYIGKDDLVYGKLIYEGNETKNIGKILFKKLKYNSISKVFKGVMCPPDATIEIDATLSFISDSKIKVVIKKFVITNTKYVYKLVQFITGKFFILQGEKRRHSSSYVENFQR